MNARHSPARRHYLTTVAAAAAVVQEDGQAPDKATANAYELMLLQLAEHRRRLKQVQSIERKIEAKRAFLQEYAAWIAGVLAGNRGGQDDVFVTVMVWMIDTGDLAGAVPLVEYALRHGLTMPDQYQRTIATVAAEEYADTALKRLSTEGVAWSVIENTAIEAVLELTRGHDMPDEVRAKLHKALGYGFRALGQPQHALAHLQEALRLNDKVGVKKDIERLEREIAKATNPTTNTPPADTGQG